MITKNRTLGVTLTTSNQDIYIVPPTFKADVDSIFITNTTTSFVTFSLDWYNSAASTYHTIAETIRLEPNSMLQITKAFYLLQNDKIRGLCSVNNAVEVSVKTLEQYAPAN
jgi:hypothetical protein